MRSLVCFPFCMVLFLLCLAAEASQHHSPCCLKTSNDRIPKNRVLSYTVQNAGICPINAIVVLTKRKKLKCFDPDSEWIKEIITTVEQRELTRNSGPKAKRQKKNNNGKRRRQKNQKKA